MAASAYHDESVDHHGGDDGVSPVTGRQFVIDVVAMLGRSYLSTSHLLHNSMVQVAENTARVETYYTAWHRFERQGRLVDLLIAGRYLDRFELRAAGWRIARRWRVRDWSRLDPVLETQEAAPGWPRGQRSQDDPLYSLLLSAD